MNSVFTAKLLQNLRNKKANKGFTLIELLVVVIIIGVLAAVALPNLLGQVAKGRQAEAKNNLGALNRAQQAYRLEKAQFGVYPTNLASTIQITGEYYDYAGAVNTTDSSKAATHTAYSKAAFQDDILDYASGVGQTAAGAFNTLICEATQVNGSTNDVAVDDSSNDGVLSCTNGSKL
ncbi:MAG: hypothetical protein Tsb0014_29360 [Pleurocapsa sp.]